MAPVEETEVATIGGTEEASAPLPPPQGPLARRKVTGGDPLYPEMSKRLQEEGPVELAVEVGKDGSLRQVRITKSSGYERLDQAALAAVRQWTFTPRTGEEAALVYHQRFVFRLVSQRD
jgi:protein TonB